MRHVRDESALYNSGALCPKVPVKFACSLSADCDRKWAVELIFVELLASSE